MNRKYWPSKEPYDEYYRVHPLPTVNTLNRIHRAWDELADFGAADHDKALRHCMRALADLLSADNVCWVAGVRLRNGAAARQDPMLGWRAVTARILSSNPRKLQESQQAIRKQDTAPAMTSCALVREAGKFRTHRLRDGFVDWKAYRQSSHYQHSIEQMQILDRLYTATPINSEAESYFVIDRNQGRKRFTKRDQSIVTSFLRGLKWFQKDLMLAHGLNLAQKPLTTTEQRIMQLMLTDKTEAEIAQKMGQSPHTTHDYVKSILRKYGVRGRTGLMALWLARGI